MVEVKWWSMFNFEAVTSKFCNCSWKFGFLSWKGKVDPCMTNSSKVLIYLTLLYSIFYCTLVSNVKGNIAKSNKSELWNCLSYLCLPYLFKVRSQTFRNYCKILRSNSTWIIIRPQWPPKAQVRILKKMSLDNPVSPIDVKNNISFSCHFWGVSLDF